MQTSWKKYIQYFKKMLKNNTLIVNFFFNLQNHPTFYLVRGRACFVGLSIWLVYFSYTTVYLWFRCSNPTELGTYASSLLCEVPSCAGSLLPTQVHDLAAAWHCERCSNEVPFARQVFNFKVFLLATTLMVVFN